MDYPHKVSSLEAGYEEFEKISTQDNFYSLLFEIEKYLDLGDSEALNSQNALVIKEYVASAILRVFKNLSKILWEDIDLRLKVFSLLDTAFGNKLYKSLGISASDQNHDKTSVLETVLDKVVGRFESISNSIVSLDTAAATRKRYMREVRDLSSDVLIKSHIYDESLVSTERLTELFNSLEGYIKADRMSKLEAFGRFELIFDSYSNDFEKHYKNILFLKIIAEPLGNIRDFVKADFDGCDLNKPADINVYSANKKYPLDSPKEKFEIKVVVDNKGPGVAFNTRVIVLDSDACISLQTEEIFLDAVDVGRLEIFLDAEMCFSVIDPINIIGILSYTDYKGDAIEEDFEIEILPQNSSINWDEIQYQQPYSLESVELESDLIGRKDLLYNISSKLTLRKGESSIIHGQKRVGKTSLAKTIQSRLNEIESCIPIFIETGSLDKTTPNNFIRTLGEKVHRKIKSKIPVGELEKPIFEGSLQPLVTFIEDVVEVNKMVRIVIILDEFDEIPSKLYPYTEAGDSFFHSLRSLSGESGGGRVSLVLVGGENIDVIMQSTDKLNKFDAFNVGYFDRSDYWADFKELLISPVKDTIEFTEEAILTLYEYTEGNPFYTKFIAKKLYKKMCEKRCSYITNDEMLAAIRDTINNLEAINVNHFWSDGIRVEDVARKDLIETQRRRFLIGFAESLRECGEFSKSKYISSTSNGLIPAKEIVESFIGRKILVGDGDILRIKPKLFEEWLVERGVNILRASFSDEDALSAYRKKEELEYITDSELLSAVEGWELYRGSKVGVADVRNWLSGFESNAERRSAFKLLTNIEFYGEIKIREKLKVIHDLVRREITYTYKESEKVRKDVLISCFGGDSKSGASYLRMYATENAITTHSIKKVSDIKKTLNLDSSIKAVVFVDDIIASGGSMIESIRALDSDCGDLLRERNVLILVGVIVGLSDGVERIEAEIKKLDLNIKLKVCDIIGESDKAFSPESRYFDSDLERTEALSLARKYGAKLQNRHPLGYYESQLLVVFKDNCPNNTLPIFWASSNKPVWKPLFKRS